MTKNILKNKIDFVAFISVRGANPNGDPNNENLPRTDDEMYGEMSSGCIHRKIRNRMQDMGHKIYVQSEERTDDKYPYGKPQTDEVARGSGNREYGCRRLREKLPNFSGVSFLEPGIPVIE